MLQRLANSASHFQSSVEPLFNNIREILKAFLDDFSLHQKTESGLLEVMERFFELCEKYGLFLSPKKCPFFKKELKWCGIIRSKDGIKLDPRRISGLRDIEEPKNGSELAEFIYSARRMSNCLPHFCEVSKPLVDNLEAAYTKSGRRTKRSIQSI